MRSTAEHVLLPPSGARERDELAEIAELVTRGSPQLVGPGQRQVPLPRSVQDALVQVVEVLQAGQAVTVGQTPTMVTTQQAAQLLGVSRPTVIKLLEAGKLAYERPGSHRRIRLSDVLAYRAARRVERAEGLAALVEHDEAAGLYEDLPGGEAESGQTARAPTS